MRTRLQLVCSTVLLLCLSGFAQSVGNITTVAGTGTGGYAGDGGLSTSAKVFAPFGVAVDKAGNFYIADTGNNRVRKVSLPSYVITTVAGNGKNSFCGDGGPATSACLNQPTGVALDSAGNLYIADNANSRVRKVDTSGKISTYAGNGSPTFCGDGQPATLACLHTPTGVAVDSKGNVYVADEYSCRVRKILASNHTITTVAGNGAIGSSGDGGPAIFAELGGPTGVAVDPAGNIYIADWGNHRVRQVNPSGPSPPSRATELRCSVVMAARPSAPACALPTGSQSTVPAMCSSPIAETAEFVKLRRQPRKSPPSLAAALPGLATTVPPLRPACPRLTGSRCFRLTPAAYQTACTSPSRASPASGV